MTDYVFHIVRVWTHEHYLYSMMKINIMNLVVPLYSIVNYLLLS